MTKPLLVLLCLIYTSLAQENNVTITYKNVEDSFVRFNVQGERIELPCSLFANSIALASPLCVSICHSSCLFNDNYSYNGIRQFRSQKEFYLDITP